MSDDTSHNPYQDHSSSHNTSVDAIHSIHTATTRQKKTKKSFFSSSLSKFHNFTFLPTNRHYVASSVDPPPMRLFKRKSSKKKPEQERRSTRSFRVRADLQLAEGASAPQQAQQAKEQDTTSTPATSLTDSSSDSSSSRQQQQQQQPYYRGGGYCSHIHRTYEERWSPEHVDLVVKSWNMTPRQRDKLLDLKERVQDVDHFLLNDPHQLVYFLLDEAGNVELAEQWFRKIAHDRKQSPFDHDTLCTSYELPDDYDYFPIGMLDGTDRDGDPISFTRTGAADCWGLYQRHGRDAMIRHALYYQELCVRGAWMDEYERKMKRKVTRFTVIFDLQGLSLRHIKPGLLPVLSFVSRLVQDSYPELVKRVIIIHAPSIFKMIWGLVKHFFDQELRDLMIFGTSDANSREVMEQFIDPNVIPHVMHSGGKDGRVAKGYEHIIMEGGLLPPEGTYTTPQRAKEGRTRAEDEEYRSSHMSLTARTSNSRRDRAFSDSLMGETVQMSNLRKDVSQRQESSSSVTCQCKNLLGGNYSSDMDAKVLIQITSGNRHLVGLN